MKAKQAMSKSQVKNSVRFLAIKTLVAVEQDGEYVNLALNRVLNSRELSSADARLLTEIIYGVTQRRLLLDALINPLLKKDVTLWLRTVLRVSVFQIVYLDKIPNYAIVNEAANITRIKFGQNVVNFVNALLHTIIKNYEEQLKILQKDDSIKGLSIYYSTPEWLVTYLIKQVGMSKTKSILHSLLEKPVLSIRANDVDKAYRQLIDDGFLVEKSELSPVGLRVANGRIAQSELFLNGDITIQDESSQLVAFAGSIQDSDRILDACAGPGGKTAHIASFLNDGSVTALDLYTHKLELIRENVIRMHLEDRVDIRLLDATKANEVFEEESFDVIFVDAPCSGIGLMRRKPDIKYTKISETIDELVTIQGDILNSVAPLLKKGGRLVYSTCTILEKENDGTVQTFLRRHPNFQLENISDLLKNGPQERMTVTIYPDDYQTDGFFIAVMTKNKNM